MISPPRYPSGSAIVVVMPFCVTQKTQKACSTVALMRGFRFFHHTEKVGGPERKGPRGQAHPSPEGALTWLCRRTECRLEGVSAKASLTCAGRGALTATHLRHRVRRRRAGWDRPLPSHVARHFIWIGPGRRKRRLCQVSNVRSRP